MRFFSFLLAAGLFAAATAVAEAPIDSVRKALDTRDFAAVESILRDEAEKARAARDFSALRKLYGSLFETANSARLKQQEAWLAAYPDSPRAAAALGWSHIQLAYLARGTATARFTSREAFSAHRKELLLSLEMADRALKSDPAFVPALDLSIALATLGGGQTAVPALVERTLAVAPDPHALSLGLVALSPRWGGSVEAQFALCDAAKDILAGFDDDICLIYAVFSEGLDGKLRQRALAALDKRDEPFLDFARGHAYRNEWRSRPEAGEESQRIFLDRIRPGADADMLTSDLRLIADIFRDPFFQIEAEEAILASLRERLRDDPENYRVLGPLLADIFDNSRPGAAPERADEARALWQAMLVRGAHNPEVWSTGARLEDYLGNSAKPALTGPYAANEIYYSNHDPNALRQYVVNLLQLRHMADEPRSLPAGVAAGDLTDDVLLCPMFRAQRLYEYACGRSPADLGCNTAGWGANASDEVGRLMSRTAACAWERTAPVDEIAFQPVPVSHFAGDDE